MEWLTPKTDWAAHTSESGLYTGDYFNVEDYNRIKNNIEFLADVAKNYWPIFIRTLPDKTYEEYPYADEINQIADNLDSINEYIHCEIGTKTEYTANGAFIGYEDLNRIERGCLAIYEALQGLYTRPPRLPFRMGAQYWPHKVPKLPRADKTHLPFNLNTRLGAAYHPFKNPVQEKVITEGRRLPFRMGSDYFPFKQ